MNLTFTLQSAYTGATYVAGPFNITGITSDDVAHELATGVTKTELITGYSINTVFETLTGGTIQSTSTCNTSQTWCVGDCAPPENPNNLIQLRSGTSNYNGTACVQALLSNFNSFVFHPTDTVLVDGHTYYDHNGNIFSGAMGYFSDGITVGRISYQGLYIEQTSCSGV